MLKIQGAAKNWVNNAAQSAKAAPRQAVEEEKIDFSKAEIEPLFADANYVNDTVAFDDDRHLITSRGPATSLPFAFAIVDALGGDSSFIKGRFLYNALKDWPDRA